MRPATENTALLLFARTPRDEVRHKRLLGKGQERRQEQIYRKLNLLAKQLGQQTGLPFFVVYSGSQQGQTFGERLYRALAGVFAQGYKNVIAIGNDCAQLRTKDIAQANALLQNHKAVFGPAQDGGVYLLGVSEELFTRPEAFLSINWQTSSVLQELQTWAQQVDSCTLPAIYTDLDNTTDWQRAIAARWLPRYVLNIILRLFEPLTYAATYIFYSICNSFSRNFSFRGPPAYR